MGHITTLPAEILNKILLLACRNRSLKRALRLKLVYRLFRDYLPLEPALFALGHLEDDEFRPQGPFLSLWQAHDIPRA